MSLLESKYQDLLSKADIQINGDRPWDIKVHDKKLWKRVFLDSHLGLGESYMEGLYDVEDLEEFFYRITFNLLLETKSEKHHKGIYSLVVGLISRMFNMQTINKSKGAAVQHYNAGNDLYEKMLGDSMAYTCGYWKDTDSLDQAQINKFNLIAKKLGFKPGMKVLDIGCGFGSAMAFFAKEYGIEVTGVTLSKEQAKYGNDNYKDLPIEIKLMDYRLIDKKEKFDRIYSIGVFEHVGYKNYNNFMKLCKDLLIDDGLMLLHTISSNVSIKNTNSWISKYVYPNAMLSSMTQIAKSSEKSFILEDVHNFGHYYHTTLMAWHKNFNDNWPQLSQNYDDVFYRMWNYYLLICAGSFRARYMQLYQVVFSANGVKGVYNSYR
jgi:cyclopropane-fatty-acyl-phospholipid synthase